MYLLYAYVGGNCVFSGTTNFVPRIGETIGVESGRFRVVDVIYEILEGVRTTTPVILKLETC